MTSSRPEISVSFWCATAARRRRRLQLCVMPHVCALWRRSLARERRCQLHGEEFVLNYWTGTNGIYSKAISWLCEFWCVRTQARSAGEGIALIFCNPQKRVRQDMFRLYLIAMGLPILETTIQEERRQQVPHHQRAAEDRLVIDGNTSAHVVRSSGLAFRSTSATTPRDTARRATRT